MRRSSLATALTAALATLSCAAVPAANATPVATHVAPAPVSRARTYDEAAGVSVVWVDPSTDFDHVLLRYARGAQSPGRDDGRNVRLAKDATSATLAGLHRDTVYSVTIWAVDAHGTRSLPKHLHVTTDAAGRGDGRYAARYFDSAGHPLAGVSVTVTDYASGITRSATSDADGRVRLVAPAGDVDVEAGGQHITGGTSDATGYLASERFVTVRAGHTTDGGDTVLRAGGALQLHVVDRQGAAVAGLTPNLLPVSGYVAPTVTDSDVLVFFEYGVTPNPDRTDADGDVVVKGVPAHSAYQVCAGAYYQPTVETTGATYHSACTATAAVARPDRVVDLPTLTLDQTGGATVSGRVQRHGGVGFANAGVEIRRGRQVVADVATDANGSFRVGGLAAGTYRVCAFGEALTSAGRTGYRPGCNAHPVVVPDEGSGTAVVTVRPGGAATGTVTGPGDVPVPDAFVEVHGHGDDAGVETDQRGQFVATGLATGTYSYCVSTESVPAGRALPDGVLGNCARHHRSFLTRPNHVRTGLDVALTVGASVAGAVVDSRGRPVPRPLVIAESKTPLAPTSLQGGPRGAFVVAGLSPAPVRFCAVDARPDEVDTERCSGFVQPRIGRRVAHLRVVLPATSSIDVTTLDDQGRPVAGVSATAVRRCSDCDAFPLLAPARAAVVADATTAGDGGVRLDGLTPGRYDVCLFAFHGTSVDGPPPTGYADRCTSSTFDVMVRLDHPAAVRTVLQPGGAVSGRVTDPSGNPLADVLVHVTGSAADDVPDDGFSSFDDGDPNQPSTFSRTAADGTYTVRGVRPGSASVCFDPSDATGGSSTAGYRPQCAGGAIGSTATGAPVSVTAAQTSTADIALTGAAGVAGTATIPRGVHVFAAYVEVFRNGQEVDEAELGRSGKFRLTQLPAGTYVVCAGYDTRAAAPVGRCYRDAVWDPDRRGLPSGATPVDLTVGTVVPGIDVRLPG